MSTQPNRPLPVPDAATAPYWRAAREGRLEMPRCRDCLRFHFYPRSLCPHCGSAAIEWMPCRGRGTVYSYTAVHRAPSPAFADQTPYVIAIVQVDEGPRLMTKVIGAAPESISIGMKVRSTFIPLSDEISLPVFEPG